MDAPSHTPLEAELLAALKDAHEALQADEGDFEGYWQWDAYILDVQGRIGALVAKAEGRS